MVQSLFEDLFIFGVLSLNGKLKNQSRKWGLRGIISIDKCFRRRLYEKWQMDRFTGRDEVDECECEC